MSLPNIGLSVIEIGGVELYDARPWFPTKTTGGVMFYPRAISQITGIAIHQDAVAFSGADLNFNGSTVDEERSRMQASFNWHTKFYGGSYTAGQGWNWPAMGYHFYTFPSGRVYLVGGLGTIRAHVANRNTPLVGVVGAGTFMVNEPHDRAIEAYGNAVAAIWGAVGEPIDTKGHREWATAGWATSCPGDTFAKWVPDVIEYAIGVRATLDAPDQLPGDEIDMTFKLLFQPTPFALTWLIGYVMGVPIWKRYINFQKTVEHLSKGLGAPTPVDGAQLRTIPTLPIPFTR